MAQGDESVFNGIAQELVRYGVPAVVATQFSLSENSAIDFSKNFYQTLAIDDSLLEAVRYTCEVAIEEKYKELEWYRPIVFMRHVGIEDGRLFDFDFDKFQKFDGNGAEEDMAVIVEIAQGEISILKKHVGKIKEAINPLKEALHDKEILTYSKFEQFLLTKSIQPISKKIINFLMRKNYDMLHIMDIIRIINQLAKDRISLVECSNWFKYNNFFSSEYTDRVDTVEEVVNGLVDNLNNLDKHLVRVEKIIGA